MTDEPSTGAPVGRSWVLGGITALAVVATFAFALKASRTMVDFEVYWRAAGRAAAGEPLYQAADGHWLFKYLPAFAIVAMPIAWLPMLPAKALWFAATLVLLVYLLRTSVALLPDMRKARWAIVAATIVVMGKFYVHELALGQTNLMLVATIAGALLALKRGREALAGLLVVVAILLKPYAVIFLPWLAARRKRDSIVSAAAGMSAALLLPVVRYGFSQTVRLHEDWLRTVVASTEPNLPNPDNVSWLAMYNRWTPGTTAAGLTIATVLAALGTVWYVYSRRRNVPFPELLEGGLLLILMPLLSPQGWDYTLLVATPAIVCLVNYEDRLPPLMRGIAIMAMTVIGLSIYDVIGRTAYHAFMRASGITLCFFLIIAALATIRQQRIA